ncbi:hypothetical protein NFI95_15395 [Acetobacteraceae bacterium KSS8]|uniref:Uncharacterized protein n=1 Tax=Endosaccharibacter trunci TaxID=2812733 RepID=A0ABT1WDE1_9PROT|nr:hypothetical protein [Acetobacteraceae bacterium KSS8]
MRPSDITHARAVQMHALRDLGLSLEIGCACFAATVPPIRLMLTKHPHLANRPLGWVVDRLRCSRACRGKPTRVVLLDAHEHASWLGHKGDRPMPWHVVLVGENWSS